MVGSTDCVVSNDLLNDPAALRERMARDGYLFFRDLLDRQAVRQVRQDLLELCRQVGWLAEDAPLEEAKPNMENAYEDYMDPGFQAVRAKAVILESVHALMHRTELVGVIEKLAGEPAIPHLGKEVRIRFPRQLGPGGVLQRSAPHQDFVHNQGTVECYSGWAPIGDVPRQLGGLEVLTGSHKHGVYDVHASEGGAVSTVMVDESQVSGQWVTADYQIGDFMFFHSLTVHKAPPNLGDSLRFSLDCRYQGVSQPFSANLLKAIPAMTEMYANWKSKDLQYYWQRYDLKTVEHDMQYYNKRDAEAIEHGRAGDQSMRTSLLRILNNPMADPKMREEAEAALDNLEKLVASPLHPSPARLERGRG